jgi:hypothetical protein
MSEHHRSSLWGSTFSKVAAGKKMGIEIDVEIYLIKVEIDLNDDHDLWIKPILKRGKHKKVIDVQLA